MADKIVFDVNLPSLPTPNDVASRELSWSFDRGAGVEIQPIVSAGPTDLAVSGLGAPQDSSVHLSLVDVDNAGNRSPESVFDFVATDSVAPGSPGTLSVNVVEEVIDGFPDA